MAASKANYIIVWKKSSQVYSATNLATAVKTPIPKGCSPEDKRILFMSYLPDEETLCVYPLSEEEINKETENDDKESE